MKSSWIGFHSPLAPGIEAFLDDRNYERPLTARPSPTQRNARYRTSGGRPRRRRPTAHTIALRQQRKFLGFSFTTGPDVRRVIAPAALDRFKARTREIARRAKGVSMDTTMAELAPYLRGWRGYFGFCETPVVLQYLTRWVRLRLRALWRQWHTPRRRRAALIARGVSPPLRPSSTTTRPPRDQ